MITERIQEAIRRSGVTRYRISKWTGIGQDHLCHFLKGESSMSLSTVNKIHKALLADTVKAHRAWKRDMRARGFEVD
jgi:hypothetical protein